MHSEMRPNCFQRRLGTLPALVLTTLLVLLWAGPVQVRAGNGGASFFDRAISGRYSLLEDDFVDLAAGPDRYAYLQEPMENYRAFQRPDGPEFAIFNLQWRDGEVSVTDCDFAVGEVKLRRGSLPGRQGFFYRLFSGAARQVAEQEFSVPHVLHYDYAEPDGTLSGGALARQEADFVLKVPLPDKATDRIIFFRQTPNASLRQRSAQQPADSLEEAGEVVLGGTLF